MLTLSDTLAAAMAADKPQRILLEFPDENGVVMSNEEIVMNRGLQVSAPLNADKELTLGMCPSVEARFSLLNDVRQLSSFEFGECKVWIGARIDSGTPDASAKTKTFTENGKSVLYEFAPVGIFVVDRPDIVQVDIIDITASDRMVLFDEELPSMTDLGITFPTTIGDIAQALCDYVGVTLATQTFLNSDLAVSSRPRQFDNRTMREVLKWIAEAAGGFARFNRYGQLEIVWFRTTNVIYDETQYKDFTPCWYEVAAIDGLKVRNESETSESSYGTDPENAYVIAGNPFLR